ncbi:MAG: hypothetical protein U0871_11250 [Gemmataceae bacterium]
MTGNGRTVRLVERRTAVRRLPRADVTDLLTRFRHVVEVTPDAAPGRYRLTARGWVGSFRTANRVWEVRPKAGWEQLAFLDRFDGSSVGSAARDMIDGPTGLLSFFATRLAVLMADRAAAGLVRGYSSRSEWATTLRGRLDLAELARAPSAPPGQLPVEYDDFTADVPWNQYPLTVARTLLARPGLQPTARAALSAAADSFGGVNGLEAGSPDLPNDPRLAAYRDLFDWCRLISATSAGAAGANQPFLINLEHLFQTHVERLLRTSPRAATHWSVQAQRPLLMKACDGRGPDLTLIPDLVVYGLDNEPVGAWDVKWKPLRPGGPDPADVQQVLGYATAVGAGVAGLIYPGRRFTVRRYATPGERVRLYLVTHRTAGEPVQLRVSADRLARLILRDRHCDGAGRA